VLAMRRRPAHRSVGSRRRQGLRRSPLVLPRCARLHQPVDPPR